MQQIVKILVGLPGSGKSTYTINLLKSEPGRWAIINWDNLRHFDEKGNERPYRFTKKSETDVRNKSRALSEVAPKEQIDAVIWGIIKPRGDDKSFRQDGE